MYVESKKQQIVGKREKVMSVFNSCNWLKIV